MKFIFFSILTALAIFACDKPQKNEKLSLFCYARFDNTNKAMLAEATLNNETAKRSIEIKDGIRYQGMPMKLVPGIGMIYRYEYKADFLKDQIFEWPGEKNVKNKFVMSIEPITAFSFNANTISISKPASLTWSGAAMGKGETLVFMWENKEKGLTTSMEVSSINESPVIELPPVKLKELSPGNWSLYLVRKKLTKELVGGLPVNGIFEYYTDAVEIKVIRD